MKNANVFGLSLFGDGATIKRIPMINVMCAGVYNTAAVLDVVDTTGKKKRCLLSSQSFFGACRCFGKGIYPNISWE